MVYGFGIVLDTDSLGDLKNCQNRIAEIKNLINMPDTSDESKDFSWEFFKKATAEQIKFFILIPQKVPKQIINFITDVEVNPLFQIMWFNKEEPYEVMKKRLLTWMSENADVCKIVDFKSPIAVLEA